MLKRAYRNRHVGYLDIDCPCSKLGVRRDALETLDHVQIPELRSDQRPLAAAEQPRNGTLGAKQRFPQLDVAAELSRDAGEPVEVLGRRVGHDVAILRSPHDAP